MIKKFFFAFALILTVAACDLGNANGFVPTNEEIEQIRVGVDTKETVQASFGRPAFEGETGRKWYYVAQYHEALGPLPASEVQRRGLVINFNAKGVVSSIETFGLEDGRKVPVSNQQTESGGRKLSFWDQFRGSIGNFSAENLLGSE